VAHADRRLQGDVIIATSVSNRVVSALLIAIVAIAAVFASLASYARKETVVGWVAPQGGLIRVQAPQGGLVEALHVREGDMVPEAAALATLKLSADLAGGDMARTLDAQMTAEGRATEAQATASRAKLRTQRSELTERRAILERQLDAARDRVAALEQRRILADTAVARGEALRRQGFVAQSTLDQLRTAALSAADDLAATRGQAGEIERQIADLRRDLAVLPADVALVDARAAQSRAALSQKRVSLQGQSLTVARAPIAGRIVALPLEQGQVAPVGGTVAVLIPKAAQLTAELYVPSRAAGFIRPGQDVRLMYQAFPYQTFGSGRGVVRSISSTVLAPSEVAIAGLKVQEPVFRVRVGLDRQSVSAYGKVIPLQPGMLLSADVVIDRRSLLQWLLDPLYAAGRRT